MIEGKRQVKHVGGTNVAGGVVDGPLDDFADGEDANFGRIDDRRGGQAAPVYVVDRTDIIHVYVDVPERDADYVHSGSAAKVKIWAYRDEWLPATVTRFAWALNPKSRTLRAKASIREMLGWAYLNLGEAKQAVKQYERALALREAIEGDNDPDTADCRNKLAVAYRQAGRTNEATRLINQNAPSPDRAAALAVRGSLLLSQNKPVEAELKLRDCLAIRDKIQPDDWTTFHAKSLLGEALLKQKKYADAEPFLRSGYEGLKKHEADIPTSDKPRLAKALQRLVQLYTAWGKHDEADKWKKQLETVKGARNRTAPSTGTSDDKHSDGG
jgi:tetratricopeptide (TPR) repeat protein